MITAVVVFIAVVACFALLCIAGNVISEDLDRVQEGLSDLERRIKKVEAMLSEPAEVEP